MTTSRAQRPSPDARRDDATIAGLEQENAQLQHAVGAHATVDQAIGILLATHRIPPTAGFEVLREVSQRTNASCTRSRKPRSAGHWGSHYRNQWARSWTRRCSGTRIG
ncbi:ANTAR domain-containing protein [Streptomyces sp. NPDC088253]|uniref:ANTAR domain-containing protein n=1 Tax=Streptomyces sp. NPDC088253 TaxID=3365846 RepID=UPI003814D70C